MPSGYINAYNTTRDEYLALADTGSSIPPGHGVKLVRMPIGLSGTDSFYIVGLAGPTDKVIGAASFKNPGNITSMSSGRVVLLTSAFFNAKFEAAVAVGTPIKVTNADGRFGDAGMGVSVGRLTETVAAANDLAWVETVTR